MISTTWEVPFPSLIDDEYLSIQGEGEQPHGIPSRLGLCIWSSKLFLILDDVLRRLYTHHAQKSAIPSAEAEVSTQETVSDVLVLHRRLDQFFESIPTYLHPQTNPESWQHGEASVIIQRQVLYCRLVFYLFSPTELLQVTNVCNPGIYMFACSHCDRCCFWQPSFPRNSRLSPRSIVSRPSTWTWFGGLATSVLRQRSG